MRRSLLAVLAVLVVALAGAGAYLGARHLMDSRGAAALDRLARRLPPGTELAYGQLEVGLLGGRVTLRRVTVQNGAQRWSARQVVLDDNGLQARNLRVAVAEDVRARAERLRVTWGDVGLGLVRMTAEALRLETPAYRLASPRVTARGVTAARLGRLSSPELSLTPRAQGGARASEDRAVLHARGVTLADTRPEDLTWLAALPQRAAYHWPAALAMLELSSLEAQSLRLGREPWLRVEGLDLGRRPGAAAAPYDRDWRLSAARFDLVAPGAPPWSALAAPEASGRLRGDLAVTLRLRPAEDRLAVADLALNLEAGAGLAGAVTLTDLPAPDSAGGLGLYLNRTRLESFDLTVTDRGLRARLLAAWAEGRDETPAALSARVSRVLARRQAQADGRLRASLDALAAFLDEGGRLHLAATPQPPPTLARLAAKLGRRPLTLECDATWLGR